MDVNKLQAFMKIDLDNDIAQKLVAETSLLAEPNEKLKNFLRSNQATYLKLMENLQKIPEKIEKLNASDNVNDKSDSNLNIKEQVQKEIPLNIASNLNTSAHITNIIVANKVILDSKPFKAEVKNEEAKNISNISI